MIRLVASSGAEETTFFSKAARSPHSLCDADHSELELSERRFSARPMSLFLGESAACRRREASRGRPVIEFCMCRPSQAESEAAVAAELYAFADLRAASKTNCGTFTA